MAEPVVYATGSATLTLLDDRLTIAKHGLGGAWQGGAWKGVREIPYDAISSVEWRDAGLIREGYLQFVTAGGNDSKDPYHDPNSIVFSRRSQAEMERAKEAIGVRRREARPAPRATTNDAADQLRKLGELRDAGIVTAQEFDAKKVELLRRM
jgi:hypothetical protein